VRGATRSRPVARTQLPVVVLLGLAWLIGVVAGHRLPGLLHLWTTGIMLAAVALMATEWWPFPAPYDRRLWERQARGKEPTRGEQARTHESESGGELHAGPNFSHRPGATHLVRCYTQHPSLRRE
jgi:hypothetical protein